MSDGTPPAVDAPQLRTLLLTDLCDSTGLVEKLGDTGAAAFFREHDHFVLELQQRWRGRLIDRSDGLLLMFERPLDGLGFALDYRRGLEDLGWAHGAVPLRARAGIHVGEVLIWRNSDEAVQAGAKSMEIEGLAKPLAACRIGLVTTAAPYQPDKGDQGPRAPYNAAAKFYSVYSGDTSIDPDLRIAHVAIDRAHTTAEDLGTYFPLAALRRSVQAGAVALVLALAIGGYYIYNAVTDDTVTWNPDLAPAEARIRW